jgi:hypothetical protein
VTPVAGEVTVIVPVGVVQVGCVMSAVGGGGPAGGSAMVTVVPGEIHPAAFLTVTLYVPGSTLLNIPLALV